MVFRIATGIPVTCPKRQRGNQVLRARNGTTSAFGESGSDAQQKQPPGYEGDALARFPRLRFGLKLGVNESQSVGVN